MNHDDDKQYTIQLKQELGVNLARSRVSYSLCLGSPIITNMPNS